MCGEVLFDSLHRGFLGLILPQTELQFDTIIYFWTGARVSPVKVMGVNLPDNVSDSLANHNTPAQTNQSEPTACF